MKIKKVRILIALLGVILIAFLGGRLVGYLFGNSIRPQTVPASKGTQVINILAMGIDARDKNSNSRSDTMILITIDPATKHVALISIPRDTRVEVKKNTYDRINTVNFFDGPEAACKVVGNLFSTKVDKYVITNFAGFIDIIDLLDGVDIEVESRMYHYDDQVPSLTIDLQAGRQHLNGQQALAYVRYRGDPTADIGRTLRQQKFIKALLDSLTSTRTILKLPDLIGGIQSAVTTNLSNNDLLYLATFAAAFDSANLHVQTAPGYSYTEKASGASYWHLDDEIAKELIEAVLQGEHFDTYQPAPVSVSSAPKAAAPAQTKASEPEDTAPPDNQSATLPADNQPEAGEKNTETEPAEPDPIENLPEQTESPGQTNDAAAEASGSSVEPEPLEEPLDFDLNEDKV